MTADQTLINLDKIIELSGSMLDRARAGEWEQVREIEGQRKKLFELIFPLGKESITDAAVLTRKIQKIADLDKETIALVAASREELSGLANKISTGRQAVNAYRDIAGR